MPKQCLCMWVKWEQSKIKLAKETQHLPPMSPCAITRASGRGTCCLAAWPSVFSVYTQNSKWVNAAGIPSTTLTHSQLLDCAEVFSGAGAVPHSDGAIHHTSTHQDASVQASGSRATVFEWLSRCVVERCGTLSRNEDKYTISWNQKPAAAHNFVILVAVLGLHFLFHIYSLVVSFPLACFSL